METMNCTARISADRAEVWVATQNAAAPFQNMENNPMHSRGADDFVV